MKYTQFLQLSEILEKQGTNISEFKTSYKDFPKKIFEDEPTADTKELDTERGRIITRWGRMKNKLNKVAKDTQKQLTDKVLIKYLPGVLNSEKEMVKKMEKPADTVQLQKVVNANYKAIKGQQDKQLNTIGTTIDKFLENISQKMYKKIDVSKITDANKLRLKNYWLLLNTQLSMNASFYIINERGKIIDSIFGNNLEASKAVKNEVFKDSYNVIQTKKEKIKVEKEKAIKYGKEAEAEEKAEKQPTQNVEKGAETETKPTETKTTV